MRLPKHLLVSGAVVIAMTATTAAALGATRTTSAGAKSVVGLLSVVDQWRLGSQPAASCPRKA